MIQNANYFSGKMTTEIKSKENDHDEEEEEEELEVEAEPIDVEKFPTFEVKFADNSYLQEMMGIIGTISTDATIKFDKKEGMSVRTLDPTHVCMIDVQLQPNHLETYNVTRTGLLMLPIERLEKIVKTFPNGKPITLSRTDSENGKDGKATMSLTLGKSVTRIAVSEGSDEDVPLPKIEYDTTMYFIRTKLVDALKQLKSIGDYVEITTTPKGLVTLKTVDSDGEQSTQVFDNGIDVEIENLPSKEQKTMYTMEYLLDALKHTKADDVGLAYSTAKPLKLTMYAFVHKTTWTGNVPHGSVTYYLAPRVES